MSEIVGAHMAFGAALREAKVLVQPAVTGFDGKERASCRRKDKGARLAGTREQLGGYYPMDVPDLDAALSWATRCPGGRYGTVEVRPVWVMGSPNFRPGLRVRYADRRVGLPRERR